MLPLRRYALLRGAFRRNEGPLSLVRGGALFPARRASRPFHLWGCSVLSDCFEVSCEPLPMFLLQPLGYPINRYKNL